MASVDELIQALKSISMQSEIDTAVEETLDKVPALIKDQLEQGLDATGKKITPLYKNNSYAKKKNKMNSAPGYGVPDMKLKGSLYQGLGAQQDNDSIVVDSRVSYSGYQIDRYTSKIYELSDQSKTTYTDKDFYPVLTRNIEAKTGLEFK